MKIYRLFLFGGLIFTDIIKHFTGIEFLSTIIILFILIDLFTNFSNFYVREIYLIFTVILLTFISINVWDSTYTIYSYIGIIPVIWLLKTIPLIKIRKFLILILICNFIIAFYEYFFQTYIYEALASRNGEEILLSYREISGNVIRSKGIFAGPLSLANFALGITLIFRKDKYIFILSLLICLMCNARLGILCLAFIYFLDYWKFNFKKIFSLFFIAYFLYLIAIYILDTSGLLRIINVFDVQSNNHTMRLYFMTSAVSLFSDYSLFEMLFGNSGALLAKVGNNAESGWLTLLVENGVIGLLFYLGFWIYAFLKSIRLKLDSELSSLIILFVIMVSQTYYLSVIGPFLFWVPILKNYIKPKQL